MTTKTLRDRRLLRPPHVAERNTDNVFVLPFEPRDLRIKIGLRRKVLKWIEENTEGDFYIGSQLLCFMADIDATAYILFDMQRKVDKNEL